MSTEDEYGLPFRQQHRGDRMTHAKGLQGRTRPRSDKGNVLVTRRDWTTLQWIGEQYVVRLDHVQTLLGRMAGKGAKVPGQISRNAARLVVARWMRAGLVHSRKILAYEPPWVWVTAKGLQELGLPFKPYTPSLARLVHLGCINAVRLRLERQYPDDVWYSERELRADMVYEKGATFPHMPDGLLETEAGDIAIEVELTAKKPEVLQAILQELVQEYAQAWYFVNQETYDAVQSARNRGGSFLKERVQVQKIF